MGPFCSSAISLSVNMISVLLMTRVEVLLHMGGSVLRLYQFFEFVVKFVVSSLDFFLEFVYRVLNVLPCVVPVVS